MPKVFMVLMLALALAGQGCAGVSRSVTRGQDQNGQPTTVEQEISDEKAWIDGQVALASQARPILELKVPAGKDLVLPGGTELRLWGQSPLKLEQHQAPWERVVNRWGGVLVGAGSAAFMFQQMRELGVALGSQPRNSFNNVGNGVGSPFSWESQKGQGAGVGVNMPTTTTFTSDDHSSGGGQ